ncbi:hypothetical protein OPS25_01465 [Alteromonas ponticola]|uniref:ZIP Zinc transporter n=1 Tax=Alteromonas aquimaris TaxID=2998417 RepID=A0ABT3P341_9ALTE|nr:hypothetical protein [Alteromonas aquimaris]MCW8107171.1 hypothetical protein [Alteromonas aquimaris]
MVVMQLMAVFLFCLIHLFAGKLRFLDAIPRSRWLSFAGGVSVAYIFIHLFPEMAEIQESFSESEGFWLSLEHQTYFIALIGLSVFYGLERLIKSEHAGDGLMKRIRPSVFWLHLSSFALYNGLIAYLLVHRQDDTLTGLLFYAVAMALHFLVNDYGLRQHHKDSYRAYGRWLLSAAILLGWVLGRYTELNESIIHSLFAFLGGSTILNVLKEELPEERKSRFIPFVLGIAVFAGLVYLH